MNTDGNRTRWPDVAGAKPGLVMVSRWKVPSPAVQRTVGDVVASVWEREPWPDGVLSYTLFAAEDGQTILHYSQWADDAAFESWVANQRDDRVDMIDLAVPGIERLARRAYRYHRSAVLAPERTPECLVAVEIEARPIEEWMDLVLAALEESGLPPGGLAAHFHLDDEGGRAFNFAEWSSAEAHRRALENGGNIGRGPRWDRARTFPGARFASQRFRLLVSLHPPADA